MMAKNRLATKQDGIDPQHRIPASRNERVRRKHISRSFSALITNPQPSFTALQPHPPLSIHASPTTLKPLNTPPPLLPHLLRDDLNLLPPVLTPHAMTQLHLVLTLCPPLLLQAHLLLYLSRSPPSPRNIDPFPPTPAGPLAINLVPGVAKPVVPFSGAKVLAVAEDHAAG